MILNRKDFARVKARLRDTILHDPRLTRAEQRIGYEIADLLSYKTNDAWPSQNYLAKRSSYNIKTVERATKRLAGTSEIDGLWFSRKTNGRGYRYIPNFDRLSQLNSRQIVGHRNPTCAAEITDIYEQDTRQNVCLSSLIEPDRDPVAPYGQKNGSSPAQSSQTVERGKEDAIPFAGLDEGIAASAAADGAKCFVYEGTKPWRAWNAHRAQNGIAPMPVIEQMVDGRMRRGWFVKTLLPPGHIDERK
jgi:hypothetical protein